MFVQRLIDIDLNFANGVFAGGGNNVTITGHRAACKISLAGGSSQGVLEAAIYGLSLSQMNQMTLIGTDIAKIGNNTIVIKAGNSQSGTKTIFKGTISFAAVDAQAMPQVCFRVSAIGGLWENVKPVPATSVEGSADVGDIMGQLAKQMNLAFENSGVNVKLASPHYFGSGGEQVARIARDAGINHIVDRGTLAIWPPGQTRSGDAVVISPQTGMVGYPAFSAQGLALTTLFDPAIKYGGKITVKSDVTPANGDWGVYRCDFNLESMVPHGQWFATLAATRVGAGASP